MNDSTNRLLSLKKTPPEIEETKKKTFLEWIHIGKGIGIALVVVGHFFPSTYPIYWAELRKVIYSFHMPLFFVISGYLYRYGYYPYAKLINSKFKRLAFPFLSTAIIFLIIKFFAGQFVNLQYPVNTVSIYNLIVDPVNSYMPLLWFVHALFLIFLVYPLIRLFLNSTFTLIFLIAVNIFIGSHFLVFGNAIANAPFFAFGVMLREQIPVRQFFTGRHWYQIALPAVIFVSFYIAKTYYGFRVDQLLNFYLSGLLGAIVVLNLGHLIALFKEKIFARRLMALGEYSMGIYLLHPLFESPLRIGFDQVLNKFHYSFEIIALFSILCGLLFPALCEKYILRKHPLTKKYILGL